MTEQCGQTDPSDPGYKAPEGTPKWTIEERIGDVCKTVEEHRVWLLRVDDSRWKAQQHLAAHAIFNTWLLRCGIGATTLVIGYAIGRLV